MCVVGGGGDGGMGEGFAFTPYQPVSIAQSLACLTTDPVWVGGGGGGGRGGGGLKFESQLGHIPFVEIDHKVIATVILPFH